MVIFQSKGISKEREINKSTFYALFFCYAKKQCEEKIYRTEVVFLIKIENFYQKNNFSPKKTFGARLSSVAMSAFSAIKPKAWETVREKDAFIYFAFLIRNS